MDRAPLRAGVLRAQLCAPAGPYATLEVVAATGSTNADLAAAAGAADRTVLVAEYQDAGRGRLDRTWVSPPGAGLTLSVLFRPLGVDSDRLGWLPLLAGVALHGAVTAYAGVPAALKWPNDLLVGRDAAKAAGILAEVVGAGAVVVGIGLNVSSRADELPPGASSLLLAGADPGLDRTGLLGALLAGLSDAEAAWRAVGGDPDSGGLRAAYRGACATLGSAVRVELAGTEPAGPGVVGMAVDVDTHGRLIVRDEAGADQAVAAGDVVHLRAIR